MEKGWVEVYLTAHGYKASIAKKLIDNEDINTVVLNQHDSAYQAFGEFNIYVAEIDAEKTALLLKNLKN